MEGPIVDPPQPPDTQDEPNITMIGVDSGRSIGVPVSWGFTDDILNTTFRHVENAMIESMKKHGRPTKDPVRGSANLMEECGEVAKEALEATRPNGVPPLERILALRRMHKELSQVAGYAFLLMISMGYTMEEEIRQYQSAPANR